MIEFIYKDRKYTQRTNLSILNEYDLDGKLLNKYSEIPFFLQLEIDLLEDMKQSPERYFKFLIKDDKASIMGFKDIKSNFQNIIIPEKIEDFPVVGIEKKAFVKYENLHSVMMPDSIEFLGDSCFSNCTNLTNVQLSKSIRTIPFACFANSNLKNINLENIDTIKESAFVCSKIKELDLKNCRTIKINAFRSCTELEKVIVPNIENIDHQIFEDCEKLKEVVLSDWIKRIPAYIFANCKNLDKITLPKNLKKIDSGAFSRCTNLKNIDLPDSLEDISSNAFSGSGIEEIKLPKSLRTIGPCVFQYCEDLRKIEFPDSLKYIDEAVCDGCINLTEIIMNNHTEYAEDAFDFDKKLLIKFNNEKDEIDIER